MKKIAISSLLLLTLLGGNLLEAANSQKLNLAVAANFRRPLEEIARLFKEETGIKLEITYSSTGKLYAQIKNGALFDLFLAADVRRPQLLYREGLAEKPVVYAQGQVVLWTKRKDLCAETTWQKVIKREDLPKIAIANPETAPYGEVAAKALKKTGLWKFVEPRLVYAQTVSQAFQYAEIGGVDLSFTALSYALSDEGKRGCYWPIPEAPSVVQEACILKRTPQKAAASKFLKFLTSNKVKPVLEKYGYR